MTKTPWSKIHVKSMNNSFHEMCVQVPAPSLTSLCDLGQLFNLPVPPPHHLKEETFLMGLLEDQRI